MPELSWCCCWGMGAKAQLASILKKEARVLWEVPPSREALESQCRAGAFLEALACGKVQRWAGWWVGIFKSCVGSSCTCELAGRLGQESLAGSCRWRLVTYRRTAVASPGYSTGLAISDCCILGTFL